VHGLALRHELRPLRGRQVAADQIFVDLGQISPGTDGGVVGIDDPAGYRFHLEAFARLQTMPAGNQGRHAAARAENHNRIDDPDFFDAIDKGHDRPLDNGQPPGIDQYRLNQNFFLSRLLHVDQPAITGKSMVVCQLKDDAVPAFFETTRFQATTRYAARRNMGIVVHRGLFIKGCGSKA
jgi:hypothetical protein